jgi:hypothetical protein
MLEYLVLLVIPLGVCGIAIYIRDTITGRAKPNKVSWLMWSVAPFIATFAAVSKGVTWAALPIFMSGFGTFCVFAVSLFSKKSYWKLEPLDYLCGFFSLLALVLWSITKEANIAIIFSIISDGSATVPTLRKAWTNPETESGIPYITGLIGASTTFAAVKYWVFPEYAFATYVVIFEFCIIFAIYRRAIGKIFLSAGKNKV